jgi:hypothetical protein
MTSLLLSTPFQANSDVIGFQQQEKGICDVLTDAARGRIGRVRILLRSCWHGLRPS